MLKKIKNVYHKTTKAIFDAVDSHKRSTHWRKVEKQVIKLQPFCAACGAKHHLQVHHIKPFHIDPKLELDLDNLITLCMEPDYECHFYIGHGSSWKAYNATLLDDLQKLNEDKSKRKEIIAEAKKNRRLD